MSPQIELARPADAVCMSEMSRRLIEAGLSPSWPPERILRHMRHADSSVIVVRGRAQLQGFAIMQFGESTAHLNLLAVQAGERRRGLGRALLSWLEDSALVAGTFLIQLELRATNHEARAFYNALGYQETGRVSGYYQQLEDAIQMAHDLRVPGGHIRPLTR